METNKETIEELTTRLIAEDEKLSEILRTKVREALSEIDLGEIIASQMSQAIETVFDDNDNIFNLIEDTLKAEIAEAFTSCFKTKRKGV